MHYACGGDGPLAEVINGAAGFDNAGVTCVPKGTGNDFLRLFRLQRLFYDLEAPGRRPHQRALTDGLQRQAGPDGVCAGVDAASPRGAQMWDRALSPVSALTSIPGGAGQSSGALPPSAIRAGRPGLAGSGRPPNCICNGRHYGGG